MLLPGCPVEKGSQHSAPAREMSILPAHVTALISTFLSRDSTSTTSFSCNAFFFFPPPHFLPTEVISNRKMLYGGSANRRVLMGRLMGNTVLSPWEQILIFISWKAITEETVLWLCIRAGLSFIHLFTSERERVSQHKYYSLLTSF